MVEGEFRNDVAKEMRVSLSVVSNWVRDSSRKEIWCSIKKEE